MKIQAKLFSFILLFAVIITLFGIYTITELGEIRHIDHEIEEAIEISIVALDFNVENYHTQLEIREYAYEPNQKRLDAFEAHRNTLDELLIEWQDEVLEEAEDEGEKYHALYDDAENDVSLITSNLRLVEKDWEELLVAVGEYRTAVDEGASDAEIKRLDSIALQKVNTNEDLFDKLQFNKKVDLFVISQGELVDTLKAEEKRLISNFVNTLYVTIPIVIGTGVIISIIISRQITMPIKKLEAASIKIAKGNLDVQVEQKGDDEISHLAKSFNIMRNSIKENIELEKNSAVEKAKIVIQMEHIKKLDKLKDEFSSMVTHELKSPLTTIKGYCEMLKDESFGTLTKDQHDYINKIDSSSVLLQRLISDVLDVQKLDMMKMSFNKESFDVHNFLDRLQQDSSHLMKDKGIEFIVTDSVKTTLKTDQLRLLQILENLIRNSVDFVPLKNGKIEVGAKQENGKMIFHVKDNGIGILKDRQQNIFKKFYQVDTSHTRKHGGSGLGLVICRGIVNALGGEIWFESEPGKETTFYFSIPIYREKITTEPLH